MAVDRFTQLVLASGNRGKLAEFAVRYGFDLDIAQHVAHFGEFAGIAAGEDKASHGQSL